MGGWTFEGVELPFGDRKVRRYVDTAGVVRDTPLGDADTLPGGYFAYGLVDAHAHPAITPGPRGPLALDSIQVASALVAWSDTGVSLIRDVGSPGGLTLDLRLEPGWPAVVAAGRFLAPEGRYFPQLLVEPVPPDGLVDAAIAELHRGATWVKVIADFPRVPEFTDNDRTYPLDLIGALCDAVHDAGGRVAAHTLLPDAGSLVVAGVDSIEHGPGLDRAAIAEMAQRGAAWTPTCCAVVALADDELAPPERRRMALEAREQFKDLLPLAVSLGVPILAGTDVVGTLAREIAFLVELGVEPVHALAAATDTPRKYLAVEHSRADIVGYAHDPREDPEQLASPVSVVIGGVRRR